MPYCKHVKEAKFNSYTESIIQADSVLHNSHNLESQT